LQARTRTGRGQHLDISMLDSLFSIMVTSLSQYFFTGVVPHRVGNRHPVSAPFDAYRASDGLVVIAVANNALFARLAEAIGHPELPGDARFSTDDRRTANEPALRTLIEQWTTARTVDEVIEQVGRAGVPVSPIWTVAQVAESDHLRHRGIVRQVDHPTAGEIKLVCQPVQFSESTSGVTAPPLLGEHTEALLRDILGLDKKAIAELQAEKVI
jgi:crotonobetainyl-CoA:carnitine CoA-transferase CaiB-like acyl-CoA transferase